MTTPGSPFTNLALIRSRTPPSESPTEAAARRRAEYDAIMNPSPEAIAEAAAAIVLAGQKARGEVEFFDAPPQPNPSRQLTADEQAETARKIVEAAAKARGTA
jgi:hypothetical protein